MIWRCRKKQSRGRISLDIKAFIFYFMHPSLLTASHYQHKNTKIPQLIEPRLYDRYQCHRCRTLQEEEQESVNIVEEGKKKQKNIKEEQESVNTVDEGKQNKIK